MQAEKLRFVARWLAVAGLSALVSAHGPAQSLRELLAAKDLPPSGFSDEELSQPVYGVDLSDSQNAYFAYLKREAQKQNNPPRFLRIDRKSGALLRHTVSMPSLEPTATGSSQDSSEPATQKPDECCTALSALRFVGDHLVLTARYGSGTLAQLVLTRSLKPVRTLFGQELFEIAPGELLTLREGSRLPAVHADLLDWASLNSGAGQQLLPLAGDGLRAQFVEHNQRELPPRSSCPAADPCEAEIFDESFAFAGTDRAGRFALVVDRIADHTAAGGTLVSQAALYLFALGGEGWLYCQQEIGSDEAETLTASPAPPFRTLKSRCQPSRPVTPILTRPQNLPPAQP